MSRSYFREFLVFLIIFAQLATALNIWAENKSYDFIIVGAGASGGTLASRLSEKEYFNVLLLEAGGEPHYLNAIPYLAPGPFGGELDWGFETDSQKFACLAMKNEKCSLARGKGLGGSTLINALLYNRADPSDYDRWERLGNKGWGYKDVLPYFIKLEDFKGVIDQFNEKYHGFGGPMPAARPNFKTELARSIIEAGQELGYSEVDYNGQATKGFSNPMFILKNGSRFSVYDGYINRARKRSNLEIVTGAIVEKVEFNGKTAVAVIFHRDGKLWIVKAKKEIILSAGSTITPTILMLSGLGPKDILSEYEIPVINHLPGVGQNLQDHISVISTRMTLNSDVGFKFHKDIHASNFEKWERKRDGPLTVPAGLEGIAFVNSEYSNATIDSPDLELIFFQNPLLLNFKKQYQLKHIATDGKNMMFVPIILLQPKSVGYMTIQGKSIHDRPSFQLNYLSEEEDVAKLVSGIKLFLNLTKTKAFQKYNAFWDHNTPTTGCKQFKFLSDEYLACHIRYYTFPFFHQCCTAKMGPADDPMAVVDSSLKVYGVKNLRVVDLSIPPKIPSGHTMIPSIMIAEKASDMIQDYWKHKEEL